MELLNKVCQIHDRVIHKTITKGLRLKNGTNVIILHKQKWIRSYFLESYLKGWIAEKLIMQLSRKYKINELNLLCGSFS